METTFVPYIEYGEGSACTDRRGGAGRRGSAGSPGRGSPGRGSTRPRQGPPASIPAPRGVVLGFRPRTDSAPCSPLLKYRRTRRSGAESSLAIPRCAPQDLSTLYYNTILTLPSLFSQQSGVAGAAGHGSVPGSDSQSYHGSNRPASAAATPHHHNSYVPNHTPEASAGAAGNLVHTNLQLPMRYFTDKAQIKPWLVRQLSPLGVHIVIERSDATKVVFKCKHQGITGASQALAVGSGEPPAKKARCSCPFRIRANFSVRIHQWTLVIVDDRHNHPLRSQSGQTQMGSQVGSQVGTQLAGQLGAPQPQLMNPQFNPLGTSQMNTQMSNQVNGQLPPASSITGLTSYPTAAPPPSHAQPPMQTALPQLSQYKYNLPLPPMNAGGIQQGVAAAPALPTSDSTSASSAASSSASSSPQFAFSDTTSATTNQTYKASLVSTAGSTAVPSAVPLMPSDSFSKASVHSFTGGSPSLGMLGSSGTVGSTATLVATNKNPLPMPNLSAITSNPGTATVTTPPQGSTQQTTTTPNTAKLNQLHLEINSLLLQLNTSTELSDLAKEEIYLKVIGVLQETVKGAGEGTSGSNTTHSNRNSISDATSAATSTNATNSNSNYTIQGGSNSGKITLPALNSLCGAVNSSATGGYI